MTNYKSFMQHLNSNQIVSFNNDKEKFNKLTKDLIQLSHLKEFI